MHTQHPLRILIIEDDESIRDFLGQVLEEEGFEVVTAAHGQAGLRLLDQQVFRLVLLDIRMPIMDGRAFLREYMKRPEPRARIVALSASQESPDDTFPHKVDGFLAKPFDLDVLISMIYRIMRPND